MDGEKWGPCVYFFLINVVRWLCGCDPVREERKESPIFISATARKYGRERERGDNELIKYPALN